MAVMEFDQSARDELQKTLGGLLQNQSPPPSTTPSLQGGMTKPGTPMEMSPEASKLYYDIQMKQPDAVAVTPNDRGFVSNFITGMKQSAADRFTMLDGLADWVSQKFGVQKGGAFAELAKSLTPKDIELQDQSFYAKLGRSAGRVPQMLGEIYLFTGATRGLAAAAGIPTTLAKTAEGLKMLKAGEPIAAGGKVLADMALPATLAGMGAGETALKGGGIGDILKAGGWGAGTGLGFEAMRSLSPFTQIPAQGALFGGSAALQGADAEQTMADTLIGMGLGIPGAANAILGRRSPIAPREVPISNQLALPPGKPAPLQIEYKGVGRVPGEAPPAENFSTIISGQNAGDAVALGRGGVMRTPSAPPNVAGEQTNIVPEKPPIQIEEPLKNATPIEKATQEKPLNKKDREILKKLGFKTVEEQNTLTTNQREAFLDLKYKKTSKEGQEILTTKTEEPVASRAAAGLDLTKMSMDELDTAEEQAGSADMINAVRAAKKIVAEQNAVEGKQQVSKKLEGTTADSFISQLKTIGVKGLTTESENALRALPKQFMDNVKNVRLFTKEESRLYSDANAVFMNESGTIAVRNGVNISTIFHELAHNIRNRVSLEDRKAILNVLPEAKKGDVEEVFSSAVSEYVTDKKAFAKRDPVIQKLVSKYVGEEQPTSKVSKMGTKVEFKDSTGADLHEGDEVEWKYGKGNNFSRKAVVAPNMPGGKALLVRTPKGVDMEVTPEAMKTLKNTTVRETPKVEEAKVETPKGVTAKDVEAVAQERIAKAKAAIPELGLGEFDLTVENLIKKITGDKTVSKEAKDEIGKFGNAIAAVKATADISKQRIKLGKEAQKTIDINYLPVAEDGKVDDVIQSIAKEGTVEKAAKASGRTEGEVTSVWIKEGVPKLKDAEEFAQWRAARIRPTLTEAPKKVLKTAREKFDQTGDPNKKVTIAQETLGKAKKLAKSTGIEPKMSRALDSGGVNAVIDAMPKETSDLVKKYLVDKPSEQALLNEMAFRLEKLQAYRDTIVEQSPRLATRTRERLESSLYKVADELKTKLANPKLKTEERVNTEKAYRKRLKNIASQVDALQVKETSTKFLTEQATEQANEKIDSLQKSLLYNTAGLEGRAKNFYAHQFVAKDPTAASVFDQANAIEARIDEKTRKEVEAMTGKKWDDLKDFIVAEVQAKTSTDKKLKAFKSPVTHLLPTEKGQTAYLGWVSTFAPEYRREELGTAIFLTKTTEGKYAAELVDMNFSKVKEIPGTKEWDTRYAEASPEVKRDMDLLNEYFKRNPNKLKDLHDLTEVNEMTTAQIQKELDAEKAAYEKATEEITDDIERHKAKTKIGKRIDKYEKILQINAETGQTEFDLALDVDRRNYNMKIGRIWSEIAKDKLADPVNIGKVVGTLDITKDPKSQAYKVENFTLDPQYPRNPIHREVLERIGINFKTSNEKFRSAPSIESDAWSEMERAKIAKKADDGNYEFIGGKFDMGDPTAKFELGKDITIDTPEDGWAQSPRLVGDNIMDWRSVSNEIQEVIRKNPTMAGDIAAAYREARQNLGPTVGPRKGKLSKEGKMMEGTIGRPELLKKRLRDAGADPEVIKQIEDMIDEASKDAAIERSMTQKMPIEIIPWGVRKPKKGEIYATTQPPAEGFRGFGREESLPVEIARKNLTDAMKSGDKTKILQAREVLKMTKEGDLIRDQIDIVDVLNSKLFTIDHNRPLETLSNPEDIATKMNELKENLEKAAQSQHLDQVLIIKSQLDDLQKSMSEKSVETQQLNAEASKNIKRAQNKLFDIVKDFVDEGVETPDQAEAVARKFVRDNHYTQTKAINLKKAAKGIKLGMGVDPTDIAATGKAIPEALYKMGKKLWGITTRWGKYPEAKAELERILPLATRITSDMKPEFFKPENILSTTDPRVTMGAGPLDWFGALYNNPNPYVRRVGVMGVLTDIVKRTQRRNIVNFMGELDDIAHKSTKGYEGAWLEAQSAIENGKAATDPQAATLVSKIKPVLEQMAENSQLKDKGLYLEGYWPHKVDPEGFWRHYRGVFQSAKGFEDLPEFLQDRMEPDRFGAMKKIASDNPTWEHMSMPEKLIVQKDLYNWVGRFTYDTLPPDIQDIIPRQKFNAHEQERTMHTEKSVHINPRDALLEYLLTSNHVATTNDFLAQVRPIVKSFPGRGTPGTVGSLMEKYIRHNILGGDTAADKAISTLVKTINDTVGRNYNADKTTSTIRQAIGGLKTGVSAGVLGPATGVMNLFQGVHELVDTGHWPILKALRVSLSESAKTGALSKLGFKGQAEAIRGVVPEGFEGAWDLLNTSGRGGAGMGQELGGIPLEDAAHIKKQQEVLHNVPSKFKNIHGWMARMALSPLTFTENMNKAGHMMAALEAGAKEGLSFKESLSKGFGKLAGEFDMGKDISQNQWDAYLKMLGGQYGAGAAHTSPYLRGPLASISSIFWSYPLKTLQFMHTGLSDSVLKGDSARFTRYLAYLGAQCTLVSALAYLGGDVAHIFGRGILPNNLLSMPWQMLKNAYTSAAGTTEQDRSKAQDDLMSSLATVSIPGYKGWGERTYKLFKNLEQGGRVTSKGEYKLVQTSPIEEVLSYLGIHPMAAKEAYEQVTKMRTEGQDYTFERNNLISDALHHLNGGRTDKVLDILTKARDKGIKLSMGDIYKAKQDREKYTYLTKMTSKLPVGIREKYQKKIKELEKEQFPGGKDKVEQGGRPMWSQASNPSLIEALSSLEGITE